MADFSNGFISSAYALQAAGQIGTAYEQSEALRAQGQFQQTMAEINERFANRRADQVLNQGEEQANLIRKRGLKVQGSQRAGAAASNVRVDDGSAGEAVTQTRQMSGDDEITMRNNAWREAFGIRTQARMATSQAKFQRRTNDNVANSTLLGGALNSFSAATRATSFGLRAIRDMDVPERTDMLSVKSRAATPEQNEYFNSIFPDPDMENA